MFEKMISWGELITIVLFVLGAALLFYLILALANLLKILKNVNKLIDDNKDNIDKTIKHLPEISENTAKATTLIKDNLEDIDKVVKNVGKISTSVKDGVDIIQKDILLKAKSFLDIIDSIKRLFEKRKAKSDKKKRDQESAVYKYKYKHGMDEPEKVEVQTSKENPESPIPEGYVKEEPDDIDIDGYDNADIEDVEIKAEDAKKADKVSKGDEADESEEAICIDDTDYDFVEVVSESEETDEDEVDG